MRYCKNYKVENCQTCTINKQCVISSIKSEPLIIASLDISSEVYHEQELVALEDIVKEKKIAVVRTGIFTTNSRNSNNEITLRDLYFPGDIIGFLPKTEEVSIVELYSLETSSLCFFYNDLLKKQTTIYIDCLEKIIRYFSDNNNYKKKLLSQRNPEKRVAMFILTIIEKKKLNTHDNIELKINLSRIQIGLYLGIVEETVVRALRHLCVLKLLDVKGKHYIIYRYSKLLEFMGG